MAVVETDLALDLGLLVKNYLFFRNLTGQGQDCVPVLKANSYGLGLLEVAGALLTMDSPQRKFFVYSLGEAYRLRNNFAGAIEDIYVLEGLGEGKEKIFCDCAAIPVINSLEQLHRWSSYARTVGRRLGLVLQFNCGINRSGLELNLAEYSREFVTKEENALDLLLVMAHLGCQCVPGSVLYEKYTLRELERFNYVASLFPGVRKSLAETRCTLYIPESRYDCTRIGIGLFSAAVSGFGIETVFNIVSNTYFDADSGKVYLKFGKANGLAEEYGEKGYVYVDGNKISVKKLEEARLLLDTENRNFVGRRALLAGHFAGDRIEGCEFASMNGTIPEELMATIFTLDRRKNGVHANVSADKYASVPVFGESMADNRAEFDSDGNLCKLFSSVAEKRIVQEGGYCSYSAEESVEAGDCLITIPIGYSSGFSRKLSGRKISMQIETGNGSTVPCELCGRVCMDQICARVARENFGLVTLAARVLLVDSSRNIGSQELLEMLNHGLLREMKNF